MKKIINLSLIFLLVPVSLLANLTGSGTFGDPYTGTISTGESFTISGIKYYSSIAVNGGTLIVNPGSTLFATTSTTGIIISGTGVLNANGSLGNIITFSADYDGDGNKAGETWANILFDNSTGSSIINYAIVEHGTGELTYAWGGGIFAYGNNITLSNSTIRNCNIDGEGGGVYIYALGPNVSLQNLLIYDNSATGNGGGLIIDGEANAIVAGCEIYNNSSSASGAGVYFRYPGTITNSYIHNHSSGEGVYVDLNGSSINNCIISNNLVGIYFNTIGNAVNCNVVNNTTGFIASNASRIINTVLWGNTTQYNGSTSVFSHSAIQGGLSGGTDAGGNQTLNASNTADTGPNFLNSASDFHINAVISPMVDGGIATFAGVSIPTSDIEGKTRIGTLDIGAYEFTYYIWTGNTSTDWATGSNWIGNPSSVPIAITDNKVIIPNGRTNYPIASSLSLSSRSSLTIQSNAGLTVSGATTVGTGCTFLLESDATGSANFIAGTSVVASGTGAYIVKMFLAGGGAPDYKWHYVTTPFNDYAATALTTAIGNPYNLLDYLEGVVTTDKSAGWDWWDTNGGTTPGFSTLKINNGYNVYVSSDQTATFTTTSLRVGSDFSNSTITCGTGDAAIRGWNLIGNPFTSSVDANQFVLSAKLVDKAIYFTKDNLYLSWNTLTHAGVGNGVSNVVPPLQGFFVHCSSGPGVKSVRIPAASRIYSPYPLYKKSLTTKGLQIYNDYPNLKFNVSDGTGFTDESIIYFFTDATSLFDSDYDAYKLFSDNQSHPQVYTLSSGSTYCMNGLPFPDKVTVVPVNIRIGVTKDYTINVLNLENLSDCKVTLIDGVNRIDLKANPTYTFHAVAGTKTDMSVEFDMSITTDINIPSKDQTSCWYSKGVVFIKTGMTGFENNSSVIIYDVNGKIVFNKRNVSLPSGETIGIPVSLENGFYITSVGSGKLNLSKKMVISN